MLHLGPAPEPGSARGAGEEFRQASGTLRLCHVSIIIPVLNDAEALACLLDTLNAWPTPRWEVIVVDGGSDDGSVETAGRAGVQVIQSPPGRGRQLSAGIRAAAGEWIWMVHADTQISASTPTVFDAMGSPCWGRFDIAFVPSSSAMRLVAFMMNLRSRFTGICTGDQAIFCHRSLLDAIGGVPEIPLMEDIELSRRLKRLSRPHCPTIRVATSSRRWQRRGLLVTVLSMWWLRARYWAGADPARLARIYYG